MPFSPELWILLIGGGLSAVALFLARRATPPAPRPKEPVAPAEAPPSVVAPSVAPPPPSPAVRLRGALSKTRALLRERIDDALGRGGDRDAALASLEEALISADVGSRTTGRLLERIRREVRDGDVAARKVALGRALEASLGEPGDGAAPVSGAGPRVVLVAGVNGVGKTTSIGKLAARLRSEGKRVLLVAADTFRAAAVDQLGIWAERVGAEIVRHQSGADPAAVAFDGMKAAKAREMDVVIVDTAGRLHTRQNLMDELRKVVRVIQREIPEAPHEVLLVLDATTGQNALSQARVFGEALGVTGVVLTKLDGTAKGGAALAVREELGVPIRWIGVGEGVEDLRPFAAGEFVAALLGEDASS
jgi:fused signal recognition particle receptor